MEQASVSLPLPCLKGAFPQPLLPARPLTRRVSAPGNEPQKIFSLTITLSKGAGAFESWTKSGCSLLPLHCLPPNAEKMSYTSYFCQTFCLTESLTNSVPYSVLTVYCRAMKIHFQLWCRSLSQIQSVFRQTPILTCIF